METQFYRLFGINPNKVLTNVKGEGFPTYVIIKKDGTFELPEAGYPMKREVLISQLEKALKE